jgi:hypothetical protein
MINLLKEKEGIRNGKKWRIIKTNYRQMLTASLRNLNCFLNFHVKLIINE